MRDDEGGGDKAPFTHIHTHKHTHTHMACVCVCVCIHTIKSLSPHLTFTRKIKRRVEAFMIVMMKEVAMKMVRQLVCMRQYL
jgi:hypothetical protein